PHTHPFLTQLSSLSLHDALPISTSFTPTSTAFLPGFPSPSSRSARLTTCPSWRSRCGERITTLTACGELPAVRVVILSPQRERRSEEHTSELQSRGHLVCRLLLE